MPECWATILGTRLAGPRTRSKAVTNSVGLLWAKSTAILEICAEYAEILRIETSVRGFQKRNGEVSRRIGEVCGSGNGKNASGSFEMNPPAQFS